MHTPVRIGLVGAGAYGEFCLAAFRQMPEVAIAAVCDTDAGRAEKAAKAYGAKAYTTLDAVLADPSVEIVALNTPPHLHELQGLAVLNARKHLFCEKPLALTLEGGQSLLDTADKLGLRLTVDYVMRRNALWASVAAIRKSGALGPLLHVSLINHAAGKSLPGTHWFWDRSKSGGIWIEHGVHFFDAFAWVAGQSGEITSANRLVRPDGVTDRVEALGRYGSTAAHFYHGFTHDGATEQTTATLAFERGHVRLCEWIPTQMEVITPVDERTVRAHLPGSVSIWPLETMVRYTVTIGAKSDVYREAIQAGMRDLAAAVRDPSAKLAVTGAQGLASLRMALQAESLSGR